MINNNITRWIVGILVVIFLVISLYSSYGIYDALRSLSENMEELTTPYEIYDEQEEQIEEMLTEDGYEVLSVFIMNYTTDSPFYEWYDIERNTICENPDEPCSTNDVAVMIEMKSFGSKSDQVWDALIVSNVVYPAGFVHWITIKSPIDKCEWTIFGMWKWGATEDVDEGIEIQQLIQYQIDELGECS